MHAITARNGVKKPILNDMDINKAPGKNRGEEEFAAIIRIIAATEILRSNNPSPGPL
jgi:hypothetical protein